MQRIVYHLLLLLTILFFLSACGADDKDKTTTSMPNAAPTATPTATPVQTSAATSPDNAAPTSVSQAGSLIDMEVVIEAPPEMAGVTTLKSLKLVSIAGFVLCSFTPSADPFIVTFTAPPGQDPPTAVATFMLSVSGGVTPNQPMPATFEIGLGRSEDPQMFAGEGTVVVAPDGKSGTFETSRLKGRWTCTFAE